MFAEYFAEALGCFNNPDKGGYEAAIHCYRQVAFEQLSDDQKERWEGAKASFFLASILGEKETNYDKLRIFLHLLLLLPETSVEACMNGLITTNHYGFLRGYVESLKSEDFWIACNIESMKNMLSQKIEEGEEDYAG